MKKQIALLMIITQLGTSSSSQAEPSPTPSTKPTCSDLIKACDKALEAKDKEIKLSDLAVKTAKDDITRLNKEVEEKNGQLSAWYRNPVVLFVAGSIAGMFIFNLTTR
jgi:peptidoglycan hydrolase CwlO-like protein